MLLIVSHQKTKITGNFINSFFDFRTISRPLLSLYDVEKHKTCKLCINMLQIASTILPMRETQQFEHVRLAAVSRAAIIWLFEKFRFWHFSKVPQRPR